MLNRISHCIARYLMDSHGKNASYTPHSSTFLNPSVADYTY